MKFLVLLGLVAFASAQLDFSSSNGDEDARLFNGGAGDAVLEVEVFDDQDFGFHTDARRLQEAGSAVVAVPTDTAPVVTTDPAPVTTDTKPVVTAGSGASEPVVVAGSGAAETPAPAPLPSVVEVPEAPAPAPLPSVPADASTSDGDDTIAVPAQPTQGGETDDLFVTPTASGSGMPSVPSAPVAGSGAAVTETVPATAETVAAVAGSGAVVAAPPAAAPAATIDEGDEPAIPEVPAPAVTAGSGTAASGL